MDAAERLAANEAFFRRVNEQIAGAAIAQPPPEREHRYGFLCECADPICSERVPLTIAEYESVRRDGRRFVVAVGHVIAPIEDVVERRADHVVVEKQGRAGELAERTNPRAA